MVIIDLIGMALVHHLLLSTQSDYSRVKEREHESLLVSFVRFLARN